MKNFNELIDHLLSAHDRVRDIKQLSFDFPATEWDLLGSEKIERESREALTDVLKINLELISQDYKTNDSFDAWVEDYSLASEPNYSVLTKADCLAAWRESRKQALEEAAVLAWNHFISACVRTKINPSMMSNFDGLTEKIRNLK